MSYYNNKDNDGNIAIAITNNSKKTVTIKKGNRIAQGVFMNYLTADNDNTLNDERVGGVGSSGK